MGIRKQSLKYMEIEIEIEKKDYDNNFRLLWLKKV